MSFIVQSILLVMAFGYVVQAQNVTQGFDFQLFMAKFANLEQMIGQLQTDVRKQEESLNGLTNKIQQLHTDMRDQGDILKSHSTLLSTISAVSTNNAQQMQIELRKHAEMTEQYYSNLLALLQNGGDTCVDQNVTQPEDCKLQIGNKTIDLYCEEDLHGGGWIVIQSRFDGSVDFFRDWNEYRNGFGKIDGEYWLGLENMHLLTSSGDYELLVHLENIHGISAFARYSKFVIGNERDGYPLQTLGSYSGTAGDSLDYHRDQKFSTHDRDNDALDFFNCAVEFHGGWWFNGCCQSALNGRWLASFPYTTLWGTFSGPLQVTKMMIRGV